MTASVERMPKIRTLFCLVDIKKCSFNLVCVLIYLISYPHPILSLSESLFESLPDPTRPDSNFPSLLFSSLLFSCLLFSSLLFSSLLKEKKKNAGSRT